MKSDSNLYFHPERKVCMMCYVDNILLLERMTEFLFSELQQKLILKALCLQVTRSASSGAPAHDVIALRCPCQLLFRWHVGSPGDEELLL